MRSIGLAIGASWYDSSRAFHAIRGYTEHLLPVAVSVCVGHSTARGARVLRDATGVCRLMPTLPKAVMEMSPRFAKLAAPPVEQVTQRLARNTATKAQPLMVPTLLTQANRSAGRDQVRTKPRLSSAPEKTSLPAACRERGVVLEDPARHYCEECFAAYQEEEVATFSAGGRAKLVALRAAGGDPAHGQRRPKSGVRR